MPYSSIHLSSCTLSNVYLLSFSPVSQILALEEKARKLKTDLKRAQDKNKYSEGEVSWKKPRYLVLFVDRELKIRGGEQLRARDLT